MAYWIWHNCRIPKIRHCSELIKPITSLRLNRRAPLLCRRKHWLEVHRFTRRHPLPVLEEPDHRDNQNRHGGHQPSQRLNKTNITVGTFLFKYYLSWKRKNRYKMIYFVQKCLGLYKNSSRKSAIFGWKNPRTWIPAGK